MASRFWVGGTATWNASTTTNWSATSGGAGGQSVPGASDTVTFDASSGGGTVTVGTGYNPSVTSITMGAFTGTLDFSAFNNSPTMATFDCSGAATKTLNMGSGTWTITGNNAVIFTFSTNTNATINYGTSTVNCTYAGSVGTRQVILGSGVSARGQLYNFKVSAGTDTFVLTASGSININGDLDYTGFAGTETGLVTGNYYGNFTLSTGMTVSTNSASVMTFLSTSGTKTINTFNKSLNFPVTFDGVGGTWQLGNDFTIGSSRTITLTNGTFNANNFNVTCGIFSSSNSNVRTLTMGSGTWTLTGNNATIWTTLTTTNLTLTATTANIVCNYSGSTGTRTLQCSSPIVLPNVSITAGSDTTNLSSNDTFACTNLSFAGFTGTWTTGNHSVAGNFTLGAGMTMGTGGNTLTMNATSGIKTFTSNGVTFADRLLTFNGVGGTWQLTDALVGTATRTLTLTNGTFDANNQNVTFGLFSSSNSNTRTLTMGSGTWTLTGNSATIWETGTTTNLTLNINTCNVVCNYSGSSGTRTVNTLSGFAMPRFKITAGSDIFTLTGGGSFAGLDYTGFTGNVPTGSWQLNGNITLGVGMTFSASGSSIFCYNPCTITTNGVILTRMIQIDTAGTGGGTVTFTDDFNNSTSASGILLTSGTVDANNKNITTQVFSSSNSNVRTLTMGTGTWTLTGTGTVWDITTETNLTLNSNTSTIKANNSSVSNKNISLGSNRTYYNILLTGGGTGTFTMQPGISGATVNNWTVDPALSVLFQAGRTLTVGSLTWTGTAGNLNTFQSTTAATPFTISVASGTVSQDYISLKDSTATGGATFYAGANSTNVSGNTGWTFTASPFKGSGLGRNTISNVISI